MKKYAVFAHYDSECKIDNYVINYLKEIRKNCDVVVFVSDSDLSAEEVEKLQPYSDINICKKHGEYDFGSYKRGFFTIKNDLTEEDELFFINDSCFCIGNIDKFFNMKNADSFAVMKETETNSLHSWFLGFSSKVFLSPDFCDFMESVQKEKTKNDVIKKYEVGISRMMQKNGFVLDSFFCTQNIDNKKVWNNFCDKNFSLFMRIWSKFFISERNLASIYNAGAGLFVIKGMPFVKKAVILNEDNFFAANWKVFVKNKEMIEKFLHRKNVNQLSRIKTFMQIQEQRIKSFVFRKKITNKGKLIIKICKIPVWQGKVS